MRRREAHAALQQLLEVPGVVAGTGGMHPAQCVGREQGVDVRLVGVAQHVDRKPADFGRITGDRAEVRVVGHEVGIGNECPNVAFPQAQGLGGDLGARIGHGGNVSRPSWALWRRNG